MALNSSWWPCQRAPFSQLCGPLLHWVLLCGLTIALGCSPKAAPTPEPGARSPSNSTALTLPSDVNALKKGSPTQRPGAKTGSEGAPSGDVASLGAKMSVQVDYRPIFEELSLPAETEAAVKAIMVRQKKLKIETGIKSMKEGIPLEERRAIIDAANKEMWSGIAGLLSPEQVERLQEFHVKLPRIRLEQVFDLQLRQLPTPLAEPALTKVRDILVEELAEYQVDPESSPDFEHIKSMLTSQLGGFDRARERIGAELDPASAEIGQRFVDVEKARLEKGVGSLDSMRGVIEGTAPAS